MKLVLEIQKRTKRYLQSSGIEYEQPGITELEGLMWKGKADIVNHEEKLIIDLKTTADLNKFKWSANKYNYDSQAYIYSNLFGYEFIFIVIDKTTHQIGIFDCSPQFYERGKDKISAELRPELCRYHVVLSIRGL